MGVKCFEDLREKPIRTSARREMEILSYITRRAATKEQYYDGAVIRKLFAKGLVKSLSTCMSLA